MTYLRLNGRLAKLEQQTTGPVDYTHMPAAQRRERIRELLLKRGVPADAVDTTRTRLQSMTVVERQAWLKNPSLGL